MDAPSKPQLHFGIRLAIVAAYLVPIALTTIILVKAGGDAMAGWPLFIVVGAVAPVSWIALLVGFCLGVSYLRQPGGRASWLDRILVTTAGVGAFGLPLLLLALFHS